MHVVKTTPPRAETRPPCPPATATTAAAAFTHLDFRRRRKFQVGERSEHAVRQGELRKLLPREETGLYQLLAPLPSPVGGTFRRTPDNPVALLLLALLAWAGCCCCCRRLLPIPLTLPGFPSIAASSSSLIGERRESGGVGWGLLSTLHIDSSHRR